MTARAHWTRGLRVRFRLWVDPQWGPCAAALQTEGAVTPGILAHAEAGRCLVNTGSTSTRPPSRPRHAGLPWPIPHRSAGSLRQEGEFPQDQHPSAASRHPHFPGELAPGSPGVTPAVGPAPPLVSAPSVLQGKHSMDFTSPVSFTFFDMFL